MAQLQQKVKEESLFDKLKKSLLSLDPVYWAENYLTLDGKPFRLSNNGYKPFADIYRYIGIKALEKDSKPVVFVKGRQVGGTIMACVLENYFVGSGLFGVGEKPPIRLMHVFPLLEMAAAYSKTTLSTMIASSITVSSDAKNGKAVSHLESLLQKSGTSDSLKFKEFANGNHIWIESTGIDADRLRGRTVDAMFFDECFPYEQCIETENGKIEIGKLYENFVAGKPLPRIKSFNEEKNIFEYKSINNAWCRGEKHLINISCGNREIKCTENHKFLTELGWKKANELNIGDLIKTSVGTDLHIRSLNDDQFQIVLGSFLGDGNLDSFKKSRYRLRVLHGINQKDYAEWKASIFSVKTNLIEKNGFSKKPAIQFNTKIFGVNNCFPKNKTNCPQWILDKIDARGIAIWFMDDGSIIKRWNNGASACLSTCSFDEDSQKRIIEKFKKIGVECHYSKYKGYYSIYFNKNGFEKLTNIISPYIHKSMTYKLININSNVGYDWNHSYNEYGYTIVDDIKLLNDKKVVYDLGVSDNHNFILAPCRRSKNIGGPIAHNCQDIPGRAITNATKMLAKSRYGSVGNGVQLFFGTPKKKGSDFYKMWTSSNQQYYHLGCLSCKKHFPLYTAESDDWEKIWLFGFTVKCPHCGFEQDKRESAEHGKWIATGDPDALAVGFHINQLYMPEFTKEKILSEKPGTHPINTERAYKNEVLGEFYQGDSSPITAEEIIAVCGEPERKMVRRIEPDENSVVLLGIDYGLRSDLEQLANPDLKRNNAGQSYTTAIILKASGPKLFHIEFALKFKKNDPEYKKGLITQLIKDYSVDLAVGDIGFSQDLSTMLRTELGHKYLVSRAHAKVTNKVKYTEDAILPEIVFERDHYIGEMFELLKSGNIKFPLGSYEQIAWLINHICSMEIKPQMSKYGDATIHYSKGNTPNDGLMALLNAYIAYKFYVTDGFTITNPFALNQNIKDKNKPLILIGKVSKKF